MPGGPGSDQRSDLIGVFITHHLSRAPVADADIFGIDIARHQVLPAHADRPVFTKVSSNTGIDVEAGVVGTVAAVVPLITVIVVDRGGVVIEPGFLQLRRDTNGNRNAAKIELTGYRNTVIGHNRRPT